MQASSPVSTPTSQPHFAAQASSSSAHASLTIDPAALLTQRPSAAAAAAAAAPASTCSSPLPPTTLHTNGASDTAANHTRLHPAVRDTYAVKQEPEDGFAPITTPQRAAIPDAPPTKNEDDAHSRASKPHAKPQPVSLLVELLQRDHSAILRPDLSQFADARDAVRRLLPYHVWNIPHHDLLHSLGLTHDPVLAEVRNRKRRRIAQRTHEFVPCSPQPATSRDNEAQQQSSEADAMQVDADPTSDPGPSQLVVQPNAEAASDSHLDDELNELGLPTSLPSIPLPTFPSLDYAESVFARREQLASRFRRTLTALDTAHRRAPSTGVSLEQLERLAYLDDREQVLAQIEELKTLKAKLESMEETREIDAATSSATIKLSFAITDEIERERERERELERIKRQQERAAAKAAKLEKEREARHRIGIFTPPPEPPSVPAPSVPAPASAGAAGASPGLPLPGGAPAPMSMAPPSDAGLASAVATPSSLPTPTPYSTLGTSVGTPGAFPFPPGASLPQAQQTLMPQAAPNGIAMASPQNVPSTHGSMPTTLYGTAPPVPPNGVPEPSTNAATTPSASGLASIANAPAMPATPQGTPARPPSKAKPKAKAAAATPVASAPATPGTPATPGATPGPTPHRGRGRPRKHPLPGTPGGPPIGSSVPRKKKEKPVKPAATPSAPGTPGTPGLGATAMSPPTAGAGMQVRPPPTMPGPAPGYTGDAFASTLPPAPGSMAARPSTMHPTLMSATSLNTPRAASSPSAATAKPPSPAPAVQNPAPPAGVNGSTPSMVRPPAAAPAPTNASIPNHPIPLLIPVASLPRLSALGIQPAPSPHIRPVIGPNGQPQGLQGLPVPIDPAQSVPAVLLGISEGAAEGAGDGVAPPGKQQILHISVVLSRLSPSQLSGLAVLMQSLQAQVEAGKRK